MDKNYVVKTLKNATENIKGKNVTELISKIANESKDMTTISLENQTILGAILGSMLHKAYCDGRKLEAPLENGLTNNPRIKVLDNELDADFIQDVLSGKIPTSKTLWVEDGKVQLDIANTSFANLSPYWQYDNFMAGMCAARSVITNWEGMMHKDPQVKKYVEIAVANGIHESWIARGNVGDWNQDLAIAYINLSDYEKDKDLQHYQMATKLISYLQESMINTNNEEFTE